MTNQDVEDFANEWARKVQAALQVTQAARLAARNHSE